MKYDIDDRIIEAPIFRWIRSRIRYYYVRNFYVLRVALLLIWYVIYKVSGFLFLVLI